MRVHIEQITERGLTLDFKEPAKTFPALMELEATGECTFTAPVKTILRVRRFGDMVQAKGTVATTAKLICARCLKAFDAPLTSRFEVTYTQRPADEKKEDHPEEIELGAGDMGLIYFEGEQIHLLDAIQEQVILALPIQALCSPACKGLCPGCGTDLNQGECSCDRRVPGGAFAALKNLKLGEK